MVLSLLVDIDLSTVTASPALGRLEIGNSDTEREKSCDLSGQEISTEENKASSREIRISITSPDDIYRYLKKNETQFFCTGECEPRLEKKN
jgi:hypothetical protein